MKTIICIVGKTGRGKDTLGRMIEEHMDIPSVCSYTTRPMREDDVEGKSHKFISAEKMREICEKENVIAYVKKPSGVEYCATLESIPERCVYIIDPDGIEYLKSKCATDVNLFIVDLWVPDDVVDSRIVKRGDDWTKYKSRLEDEKEEFDKFHFDCNWDICISGDFTPEQVYEYFSMAYNDKFMLKVK